MFSVPKKISVMNFVKFFFAILGIAVSRFKWRGVGVKGRNICERITDNISMNAKFIWKFTNNWSNFLHNGFILLLH